MLLARAFDTKISSLYKAGKITGGVYLGRGHEAIAACGGVFLTAGYDVRHGLIGAGVYASHGYERSHVDGIENTFELLKKYIG